MRHFYVLLTAVAALAAAAPAIAARAPAPTASAQLRTYFASMRTENDLYLGAVGDFVEALEPLCCIDEEVAVEDDKSEEFGEIVVAAVPQVARRLRAEAAQFDRLRARAARISAPAELRAAHRQHVRGLALHRDAISGLARAFELFAGAYAAGGDADAAEAASEATFMRAFSQLEQGMALRRAWRTAATQAARRNRVAVPGWFRSIR
jgi:hypothetical protein